MWIFFDFWSFEIFFLNFKVLMFFFLILGFLKCGKRGTRVRTLQKCFFFFKRIKNSKKMVQKKCCYKTIYSFMFSCIEISAMWVGVISLDGVSSWNNQNCNLPLIERFTHGTWMILVQNHLWTCGSTKGNVICHVVKV